MIRLATGWDLPACLALLAQVPEVDQGYRYEGMDGLTIVEEGPQGDLRGLVRMDLGRPETHIRLVVVTPTHRSHGVVARRLLEAAIQQAQAYGSQGLESFVTAADDAVLDMHRRVGAEIYPGWKVRWRIPLDWMRWFRSPGAGPAPSATP